MICGIFTNPTNRIVRSHSEPPPSSASSSRSRCSAPSSSASATPWADVRHSLSQPARRSDDGIGEQQLQASREASQSTTLPQANNPLATTQTAIVPHRLPERCSAGQSADVCPCASQSSRLEPTPERACRTDNQASAQADCAQSPSRQLRPHRDLPSCRLPPCRIRRTQMSSLST